MTPRSPDAERLPSLSRRALVLGSAGVLVAAAAMATLGFTAGHAATRADHPQLAVPTPAASTAAPIGQLTTLSLSEVRGHKPLP